MVQISQYGFNFIQSDDFVWGLGGVSEDSIALNFNGIMLIDAPSALAVAAVSLQDADVSVCGVVISNAQSGALVELPVPVPPGEAPPQGPIDELIAAGSLLGDASVNFSGYVSSQIENGGAIGAFSGMGTAVVNAHGHVISQNGFAIRTQAGLGHAETTTSGYVFAGDGVAAILNEGGESGSVTNFGLIQTDAPHTAGILATARIDFTFTGDPQPAQPSSSATVVNHGTIWTGGDGIRAEIQGNVLVTNNGGIYSEAKGILVADIDGSDGSGVALIDTGGVIYSQAECIEVSGDFSGSEITISGTLYSRSGTAVLSSAGDDIINIQDWAQIIGGVYTGSGDDMISIAHSANVCGPVDAGSGDDVIELGASDALVFAGEGDDTIFAGQGSDVFVFSGNEEGHNTIHNFDRCDDVLVINADNIELSVVDGSTHIVYDDAHIVLADVIVQDLSGIVSDFPDSFFL